MNDRPSSPEENSDRNGVVDQLPSIARIEEFWGKSVHQCPYCDGWELRGTPIAVYGKRARGLEMARAITAWTRYRALHGRARRI